MNKLGRFVPAAGVWLLVASSVSSAAVYTQRVQDYGAQGNGSADDRVPIQNTIDAVQAYLLLHPLDTGVVTFPAGTFAVSVKEDADWHWVEVNKGIDVPVGCLFMYKNITLQGAGRDSTSIRLFTYIPHFQVPPYYSIILFPDRSGQSQRPGSWFFDGDAMGFKMYDLTLDHNEPNNRVDIKLLGGVYLAEDTRPRMGLKVHHGLDIDIRRVKFLNFASAWAVQLGTQDSNYPSFVGTMSDCIFTGMGGGHTFVDFTSLEPDPIPHDYDASHMYVLTRPAAGSRTRGDLFTLSSSTFQARTDVPRKFYGLNAAMEMHGPNQIVSGNTVTGYKTGVNIVGDSPPDGSGSAQQYYQWYTGNQFIDMGSGFSLMSVDLMTGLPNTRIENNSITINPDLWISAERLLPKVGAGLSGIEFANVSLDHPFDNLQIIRNTITHLAQSPDPLTDLCESGCRHGEWGVAIVIGGVDDDSAASCNRTYWAGHLHVTNLSIKDNIIHNPLSNGIFFNSDIRGATISGNTIENPGSSPFHHYQTTNSCPSGPPPQGCPPQGCSPLPPQADMKYSAAIRIGGAELGCTYNCNPTTQPAAQNVSIPGIGNPANTFTKTAPFVGMGFGIFTDRTPGFIVSGVLNDFLTSQVAGIPYYQDSPRKGVINCDINGSEYSPNPCFGWTFRHQ